MINPFANNPEYQLPITHVPKGWGYEKWYVNNKDYCGKLLFFYKNKKCSYHYHVEKHETFLIYKGKVMLIYGPSDDISTATLSVLEAGNTFTIPPLLRHQVIALEDTELFEFSTTHKEEDSIRVIKGD